MTTRFWGALFVTLSMCSATTAVAKNQGAGTLHMGGEIVETPCGIASDSLDQTIDFGLMSMADAAPGSQPLLISSRHDFQIKLVNCTLASQIKPGFSYRAMNVIFDGAPDNEEPELLAISGDAKGVAIELLTDDGNRLPLGKSTADYLLVDGHNRMNFSAQLKLHPDYARAGGFNSLVKFTLSYL
ncbi:type 1 fimbria pilin [Serratia fonticola]|uniref:Type 1 fimbria pilin n=1 Tax=Serratia fonticola TaxID=47917 RepID=A0A559T544_SERFO|nr:fimbrial protein [Serratia fonticola]TQI77778.1 type 1 fimbria pilin [Serratia fonticola]TQI95227.1 type 1 fimbria pilin [Serratia fonticola]TVZ69724.1 type 1 fimbria pilin [Serratia fonticola]